MQHKLITPSTTRGKSPKSFLDFLHEFKSAVDEGWQLPEKGTHTVKAFPAFATQFAIVLSKADAVVPPVEETIDVMDLIEDKSLTKEDLKALCEKLGIEYPDYPQPAKVRKHMKEALKIKQGLPSDDNELTESSNLEDE